MRLTLYCEEYANESMLHRMVLLRSVAGACVLLALATAPACKDKEETLVLNFEPDPLPGSTKVAPSGELVHFDRPASSTVAEVLLAPPTKIETKDLPVLKAENSIDDPHRNVPDYKERGEAHKRRTAEELQRAIPERDGRVLFMNYCAGCHSYDGSGELKKPIAGIPRLDRLDVQAKIKDAAIYKAVSNGHGSIPGFASQMDGEQIGAIVSFVRSLGR